MTLAKELKKHNFLSLQPGKKYLDTLRLITISGTKLKCGCDLLLPKRMEILFVPTNTESTCFH